MTKYLIVFFLAASLPAFAQEQTGNAKNNVQVSGVIAAAPVGTVGAPVTDAPYSATIEVQSIQTLPGDNRIVQNLTGSIARDSEGRTRIEPPSPTGGHAPRMVLLQDPLAKTTYMLDLKNKTVRRIPTPSASGTGPSGKARTGPPIPIVGAFAAPGLWAGQTVSVGARSDPSVAGQTTTENLGFKTMQGLLVAGKRITRTIPAGAIGNSEPITIVTEQWTSPDLKAVVYSKTDNPAWGVQTYQLKNISRDQPDPSLFVVPSGFKMISDSPWTITTRRGHN